MWVGRTRCSGTHTDSKPSRSAWRATAATRSGRRRKRADQLEPLGELPPRELARLEEAHQLGERRRIALVGGHDEGARALAEPRVRHGHDRHALDLRVLDEEVLDLPGAELLAGADDDVLHAPGDGEVALGVEDAQVPGAEEAALVEGVGVEARVAVAEEQLRAPRPDLALAAHGDGPPLGVAQLDLARRDRRAVGLGALRLGNVR